MGFMFCDLLVSLNLPFVGDVNSTKCLVLHVFLSSAFFFKINYFKEIFLEYHQCQTYWIQFRPDIWSGLIWFQTVSKGYKQTTLVGKKLFLYLMF